MKLNKSLLALAVTAGLASANAVAASSKIFVGDFIADPEATLITGTAALEDSLGNGAVKVEYRFTTDSVTDNNTDGDLEVDLGDSANWPVAGLADRQIAYVSAVDLQDKSTVTFAFENGGLKPDNTYFLAAYDSTGNSFELVGTTNDFTAESNADGENNGDYYTQLIMEIDTSGLAGTETFVTSTSVGADNGVATGAIAADDPLPAGTVLFLFEDTGFAATDLASVVAKENGAAGDLVTVSVSGAKDSAGNSLEAPKTASASTVLELVDGLTFTMANPDAGENASYNYANSVIDVENATQSRGAFVAEGGADDTTLVESVTTIDLDNTAEFTFDLTDGADAFSISLTRDEGDAGVTEVELGGTDLTDADEDGTYELDSTFAVEDLLAATDISIFVNSSDQTNITSDPADVLQTGTWNLTLSVDPNAVSGEPLDVGEITVASAVDSHNWDINGMQAKTPYVYHIATNDKWASIMSFVNESTAGDATVFMDVEVYNKSDETSVVETASEFTDVELGAVPADGQVIFTGTNILEAINTKTPATLDADKNYHFGVTFTVIAPQNSVHLSVQNKSPDARANGSVLYNTGNASDGRKWQ